jgi:hypothetical protein
MVSQSAGAATDGNAGADNAGDRHSNAYSDGDVSTGCGGGRSNSYAASSFVSYSLRA